MHFRYNLPSTKTKSNEIRAYIFDLHEIPIQKRPPETQKQTTAVNKLKKFPNHFSN